MINGNDLDTKLERYIHHLSLMSCYMNTYGAKGRTKTIH